MPKPVRKNFVPAPDVAAKARDLLEQDFAPGVDPLTESLATVLRRLKGHVVDPAVFDTSTLPAHLRFTFAVISERGRVLDSGYDLRELQIRFSGENREAIGRSLSEKPDAQAVQAAAQPGRSGIDAHSQRDGEQAPSGDGQAQPGGARSKSGRGKKQKPAASAAPTGKQHQTSWTFGDLPREITTVVSGRQITGYPALAPAGTGGGTGSTKNSGPGVSYTIQDSAAEQARVHRAGVVALLREVLPSPQRYVLDHLSNRERLAFSQSPHGTVESLVSDATTAALAHLVPAQLPFSEAEFQAVARSCRAELIETVLRLTDVLAQILTLATELGSRLERVSSPALKAARSDMTAQLEQLVYPGFVTATGQAQLQHLPRYLQAMQIRLDRLESGQGLSRDATDMAAVQELEDEYDAALEAVPAQLPVSAELGAVKWMIEEFRVNLFAQQLGTAQTVSVKRIRRAIKTSRP